MKKMEKERIRSHTAIKTNHKLDFRTIANIQKYSVNKSDIDKRLETLEKEWDLERTMEIASSVLSLAGVILTRKNRLWVTVAGFAASALFQHSTQGWSPLLPILRTIGFRTRQEIDREKYALKALRGDFDCAWDADQAWLSAR